MSNMFSGFDIRGRFGETLTVEHAWDSGKAFAEWLSTDGSVAVVYSQTAKPEIVKAVIEGLRLQGRAVIDGGLGDKEALIRILDGVKVVGSVLVSHDDLQDLEIIELFDENASPITADNGLTGIATLVEASNFVPAAIKGELTQVA